MPYEEVTVSPATPQQQNDVAVTGDLNASLPQTVLHLSSGQTIVLPTELLLSRISATAGSRSVMEGGFREQVAGTSGTAMTQETVIPLIAEQMMVGKETVTTGTVRIHRDTETFTQNAILPLTRTAWEVERTPIGQLYAEKPEVRQEGDIMIFPLVEERLVAKREYFLIEEVRVRQVASTTDQSVSLDLKRDVLTVEREIPEPTR